MASGVIFTDAANRLVLSRGYFPPGNEDMEHALMYPNPPSEPLTRSDRVLSDPINSENQPIISEQRKTLVFAEEESLLFSSLKREIKGTKDFSDIKTKQIEKTRFYQCLRKLYRGF